MAEDSGPPHSDVAEFVNGVAFRPDDWEEEGRQIIRIQNLTNSEKPYNRTNRVVPDRNLVRRGDMLVSWSATLGVFVWNGEEACVNQHIFKVIPRNDLIDNGYLKHALENSLGEMGRKVHGATMKHITRGKFLEVEIPLPPLPEQKRIAAILDKADAIRRKRQEALRLTDDFLRSVFLDMFGDPVTNPKGWMKRTLAKLLETPPRIGTTTPATENGRNLVVRVGEIGATEVALGRCGKVSLEQAGMERYEVKFNDILIARAIGSRSHLGKASLFQGSQETVIFDSHVMRLRSDKKLVLSEFLFEWLGSNGGKHLLVKQGGQTAVQFNINAKQINELLIPLPPLELQEDFVNIRRALLKPSQSMTAGARRAEDLFSVIQQKAFRGEL